MSQKIIFTLGVIGEVMPYDFSTLGMSAGPLIEKLHYTIVDVLRGKSIYKSFEWSMRARNVFLRNDIKTVGDVMDLTLRQINDLELCGARMRKEVYDEFLSIGIVLNNWDPSKYWSSKVNKTLAMQDQLDSVQIEYQNG